RMIVEAAREFDLGLAAAVVGDLSSGGGEGGTVGTGDHLGETRVVAARFAENVDVIGDDVGCVAGALAVAASETADVPCAVAVHLMHLAEPAAALNVGQRQRRYYRRRNALLGMHAGMRGAAGDLHFPALRADGADGQGVRRSAIDVEAHDRTAQVGR